MAKRARKADEHPDNGRLIYTVGVSDPQDGLNYRGEVRIDVERFARLVADLVYGNVAEQMTDAGGAMAAEFARGAIRVEVRRTRGRGKADASVRVRYFEVSEGGEDPVGAGEEEGGAAS